MPIYAAAFFLPTSASIPFLLEDIYLRGGYRTVRDLEDMKAIKPAARKKGMMVYVQDIGKLYWVPAGVGGPNAFKEFDATEYVHFQSDGVVSVEDEDGEATLTIDKMRILPEISDEATHVLITEDGIPVWAKRNFVPDTTGATAGQAVVFDKDGNIVWSDVDGLPSADQAEKGDALILDADNKPIWGKVDGLPDTSQAQPGMAVALDENMEPVWKYVDGLPDAENATAGQVVMLDSDKKAIWGTVNGLPDITEDDDGKVLVVTGDNPNWAAYHAPSRQVQTIQFPIIVVSGTADIAVDVTSNTLVALGLALSDPDLLLEIHQSEDYSDTNPYMFRSSLIKLEDDGTTIIPVDPDGEEPVYPDAPAEVTVKEVYSRRFAILSASEQDRKLYMRLHNEGAVSVEPTLTLTYVPMEN